MAAPPAPQPQPTRARPNNNQNQRPAATRKPFQNPWQQPFATTQPASGGNVPSTLTCLDGCLRKCYGSP